jgi:hypothetical protein
MSRHTIQPTQASYCDPNQLRHACTHMISNRLDPKIDRDLQRGTRDTPNSMGAERQRAEAKHKQTRTTRDTPTQQIEIEWRRPGQRVLVMFLVFVMVAALCV